MTNWAVDTSHSEVTFKVRHLVVSTVTGAFKHFSGTVLADKPDFSDAQISFEADVDSIDTKNEQRDGHLKSPDFFDAANHPKLTFISKKIEKRDENEYLVTGNMTIRGTTKEIKLQATFNGQTTGFGGSTVAGFEIGGKINRHDFGLTWNATTEAGGIVVSDEVKLDINAELIKQEVEELVAA